MKKTLTIATMLLIAAVFVSRLYYPDFPLLLIAGTSLWLEYVRGALLVLLCVLLFTHPPRSLYMRYALGFFAVCLASTFMVLMVDYMVNVLDAIFCIEVAIICGLEALELNDEEPAHCVAKRRTQVAA